MMFPKFRKNRKNVVYDDNNTNNENKKEEKISLFEDKILNQIRKENIKLKQDIEIKKSIIHNEFNINLNTKE